MRAVVDFDIYKYQAASAGEKRTIKAIHQPTGVEFDCKTRTELWGRSKKRDGGVLAEFNKTQGKSLQADEFIIIDVQTPEPLQNVLHTVKMMIDGTLRDMGATSYCGYLGKGDSFRVERSTLLKYKGTRVDSLRPVLLDDVVEYINRRYSPDIVEGLEADDWCTIAAFKKKDSAVVTTDKDAMGTECLVYNPNKRDQGIVDCSGFGELWVDDKGAVKGKGRLWFYFQLAGDSADNYKANCFSDIEFADKSMYAHLNDCKSDMEALTACRDVFKLLYPTPKEVVGWRGDTITLDWKYAFDELWDMARMLRWENDVVIGTEVLDKFGLLEE